MLTKEEREEINQQYREIGAEHKRVVELMVAAYKQAAKNFTDALVKGLKEAKSTRRPR